MGWAPALHLLKKEAAAVAAAALAQDCVLCGARCDAHLVCTACDRALPRLGACCVRCAVPLGTSGTCGACLKRPNAFDAVEAAFEYRFPVDRLIQRFKFAGDLAVGAWLAERLAERVATCSMPDLLVVPPLSPTSLRERGFNQSIEIAKVLSSRLRLRLLRNAIRGDLDSGRKRRHRRGCVHCDGGGGEALTRCDPAQRVDQAELVERRRPQVVDQPPDLADHRLHLFGRRAEQRVGAFEVRAGEIADGIEGEREPR